MQPEPLSSQRVGQSPASALTPSGDVLLLFDYFRLVALKILLQRQNDFLGQTAMILLRQDLQLLLQFQRKVPNV